MKKIISKYKIIIFTVLVFALIFTNFLMRQVVDLDELWNYSFAKNIASGLIPYKDFNMVQTPLFPMINSIFLKIWNELLMMRIMGSILSTAIIVMIYKVLKLFDLKFDIAIIFTSIFIFFFGRLWCLDYNFASLLLTLIILYNEIRSNKNGGLLKDCFLSNIILGLLAGCIIMFKQTIGISVCFILLFNKILFIKEKKDWKTYFKIFGIRLLGIIIPVVLILIYLLVNGAFNDFVNYTILALNSFDNKISYWNLIKSGFTGILAIVIPLIMIIPIIQWFFNKKEKNNSLLITSLYAIAMFVVVYPISDEIHFKIGGTIGLIILLLSLYAGIKKHENKVLDFGYLTIRMIFYLIIIISMGLNIYHYSQAKYHSINHFRYLPVGIPDYEIKVIEDYILKNEPILVLDATAPTWLIPLDIYHKDYDMLLKGNNGYDGSNRLIEDINNSPGRKYLIIKEGYMVNWQLDLKVVEYVKQEKRKIGEIDIFDVYE